LEFIDLWSVLLLVMQMIMILIQQSQASGCIIGKRKAGHAEPGPGLKETGLTTVYSG
jgi:hypothetical protein